jgi:hypothetical protein
LGMRRGCSTVWPNLDQQRCGPSSPSKRQNWKITSYNSSFHTIKICHSMRCPRRSFCSRGWLGVGQHCRDLSHSDGIAILSPRSRLRTRSANEVLAPGPCPKPLGTPQSLPTSPKELLLPDIDTLELGRDNSGSGPSHRCKTHSAA